MPATTVRTLALASLLGVLLAAGAAQAATQDPATYPAGVVAVRHTPMAAGQDFTVEAVTRDPVEPVVVTVCRFARAQDAEPEVCFMNIAAAAHPDGYRASTDAAQHPAWKNGWILGYKVTFGSGADAPAAPVQGGYYRAVVGEEAAGAVVVSDIEEPAKDAPAAAWTALAFLAVVMLRRR